MSNKHFHLEEETLIIRHSGEIPEVAYYISVNFLTKDAEGPCLTLNEEDLRKLKTSVMEGYLSIILRDLDPNNRHKDIYRGLERCAVNWKRLVNFCSQGKFDLRPMKKIIGESLLSFLERESEDVLVGKKESCINCSLDTILELASELELAREKLPPALSKIF